MGSAIFIGKVCGVPIRAHSTLVIFLPLFALASAPRGWGIRGLAVGVVGAVGLFGSIMLHELGHARVARGRGGRVVEILLLPVGGMARIARMPRRPRDELWIALAGPAVSLGLGVGLLAVVWGVRMSVLAGGLLFRLGVTNLALAAFNMIPSFPMDGGRVFRAVLTPRLGRLRATRVAVMAARGIAILFVGWGCLPVMWGGMPRLMLLLVAWFVWGAAGAEGRQAEWEGYGMGGGACGGRG